MKVCFITHYTELYGANRSLLDLIEALSNHTDIERENFHVIIPTPGIGNFKTELERQKISFSVLNFDVDWYNPRDLKSRLARFRRIKKRALQREELFNAFQTISPDIIHSNSSIFLLGSEIAEKLKIPHIWHIREDIKGHYGREYDSNKIAIRHLKNASTLICTSRYIAQIMLDMGLKNIKVLPNIVAKSSKNFAKTQDTALRLGVVGLFHKRKNQLFIIKALKELVLNQNVKLSFYGSGSNRIEMEIDKIIQRNPDLLQKILVKGFVDDLDRMYAEMDILINMSEKEAFGRTTLEALQRGIPVVALNSGATPDLIQQNLNGFLIEKEPSALVAVVRKFIENSNLLQKMGNGAFESVQLFSNQHIFASKLFEIYKSALDQLPEREAIN